MWAAQENVIKWPSDGSFARADALWAQSDAAPVKQTHLSLVRDRAKKKLKPDQGGQSVEVLIVRNHLGGLGAGFFVVVPKSWARPFWHSLMMANAHAVGLKDLIRLHRQELAEPLFPMDYPETDAGRQWMIHVANKKLVKYNRTPAGKKMNMLAVDCDNFPFSCPLPPLNYSSGVTILRREWRKAGEELNAEETLVPITLLLMNKGHVEENAVLYELNADDNPTSRSLAPHESIGGDNVEMEQLFEREQNIWKNGGEKKATATSNRKQVGCVLGGGVSLQRGKGFGVGFVKLSFLKAHANEKHIHVIVRNPDTRDVRCGTVFA
ncbi:MAG: hypothetical protein K2Z81_26535 [Cyanobacteria bacterium]|nr:hypothetical protein [Cyanobacteriota bacterium]